MTGILSIHNKVHDLRGNAPAPVGTDSKVLDELEARLLRDWKTKITVMGEVARSTAKAYSHPVRGLLSHARKYPWELSTQDVPHFLAFRGEVKGDDLSEYTVASYCAAWRSFQSYLLIPDVSNDIARLTGVQPNIFVNEKNGIAVRKAKSNVGPTRTALSTQQIDDMETEFRKRIAKAQTARTKSLYPLLRDRVMYHLAIHFALRVSELVTVQLTDFGAHSSPRMREKYGDLGVLTVTGKNRVTGSIPTREPVVVELLQLYLEKVRPEMLQRAKASRGFKEIVEYEGKKYRVENLLFISERGGVVHPQSFRARLNEIAESMGLPFKICPHILRHTGCTLMVPLYSPEIAQKYMRHKSLSTTLHYYHSDPMAAGSHYNPHYDVDPWFEDI